MSKKFKPTTYPRIDAEKRLAHHFRNLQSGDSPDVSSIMKDALTQWAFWKQGILAKV